MGGRVGVDWMAEASRQLAKVGETPGRLGRAPPFELGWHVMTSSQRVQVQLQPGVLRWARERGGFSTEELAGKAGVKPERVKQWEQSGEISLAQTKKLANATHTPLGYLFLATPPDESLPIPDFRTRSNTPPERPSPDLLDTVYAMQRRQAWLRDELTSVGTEPLPFVGAFDLASRPDNVATAMRRALSLQPGWAARHTTWTAAVGHLAQQCDIAGIMIVSNGIVANNTSRQLDPDEFQGFTLVDDYAPIIFINNADYKTAQMFTIAHELAHLFIGKEGVSVFRALQPSDNAVERACNTIAVEFLLPTTELRNLWPSVSGTQDPFQEVAKHFKVSTITAARCLLDLGLISRHVFAAFYEEYLSVQQDEAGRPQRGNFWNNQNTRVGRRFGNAVVRAVKEGRLLYREAYALTGLGRRSFDELVSRSEV